MNICYAIIINCENHGTVKQKIFAAVFMPWNRELLTNTKLKSCVLDEIRDKTWKYIWGISADDILTTLNYYDSMNQIRNASNG